MAPMSSHGRIGMAHRAAGLPWTTRYDRPMEERTLGSTHIWKGHTVSVRVDDVVRGDGRHTTRDVVEHPGAVAILAWDGERLAMVSQWRHATGQVLLEIPAGTLEPDEPPAM